MIFIHCIRTGCTKLLYKFRIPHHHEWQASTSDAVVIGTAYSNVFLYTHRVTPCIRKDFIYLASTYNCVYLWSYTISIYIVFFLLNFFMIYTNFPKSTLSTLHIHTSPYIKWWKKTDENWRKGTFYFAFLFPLV